MVGACVGFVVTIDLQEEVTSRLIVDLSLPVTSNSETQMRVCSAQVVSAGYNLPCASKVVPTYVELVSWALNFQILNIDMRLFKSLSKEKASPSNLKKSAVFVGSIITMGSKIR